jgi:thiol:disulfide interchange protein DsbD
MLLKLSVLTSLISVLAIISNLDAPLNTIDHYEEGLRVAQLEDKPVFLLFTANVCSKNQDVNSWIKEDQEITDLLNKNFINIWLKVDDPQRLESIEKTKIEGQQMILKTYGQKWAALEMSKFDQNVQPLGVILDKKGNQLSKTMMYNDLKDRLLIELQNNR